MPVERWKNRFPSDQLARFEELIGAYMQELNYALSTAAPGEDSLSARAMRLEYNLYHECKQWAKVKTPLSRLILDYSAILIDK